MKMGILEHIFLMSKGFHIMIIRLGIEKGTNGILSAFDERVNDIGDKSSK